MSRQDSQSNNISSRGRLSAIQGSFWVFCSEILILPTGLVIVAFLTRKLGTDGYGLFAIAVALVSWIEWSINSLFGRATIKLIGESSDWRPVGATVARLQLITSLVAMVVLMILAGPISRVMNAPPLATYLRLFALDIPFFTIAQVQRQILVGIGSYKERAYLSITRWTARLVLILLFVEFGLSIPGAILGNIGASFIELIVGGMLVRTPWLSSLTFPVQKLWEYAGPLSLSGLGLRLFDKMDLFLFKMLGATDSQAGQYAAAQNLLLLPGIFTLSFSPLLLSTLSRMFGNAQQEQAREEMRSAIRTILLLLPVAALISGTAPEIVQLLFGRPFLPSAKYLSILIFSALSLSMVSVNTAILIAAGKPKMTLLCTVPMLLLALPAHLLIIPVFGGFGAALVTTTLAVAGAVCTFLLVRKDWNFHPLTTTFLRSVAVALIVYFLSSLWPTQGPLYVLKFACFCIGIVLLFLLTRELSITELKSMLALFKGSR